MNGFRSNGRAWPLTAKVPLAVAGLMLIVGVLLSHQVVIKLGERQAQALDDLSRSYLDGLASAIGPSVLREDSWEVFDAIERAQAGYRTLRPIETVVTNSDDRVIAASDPRQHPIGATYDGRPQAGRIDYDPGGEQASVSRALAYPGRTAGTIYARFDTRHLASDRRNVAIALALTNGLLVLAFAAAGWLLTRRMLEPVRILSDHLGTAKHSTAEIPEATIATAHGEFGELFRSYNELVHSMLEREDLARRLARERRISSLGRLASSVAHEINNPLGGLFNAVATLRSHGHLPSVQQNSIGLLDRGLQAIRDTVRTTLSAYRNDHDARAFEPRDLQDLALLSAPEAGRKGVSVRIVDAIAPATAIRVPSTPIRQVILNLLLNAIAATPPGGGVSLEATVEDDILRLVVRDEGDGMPAWAITALTESAPLPPSDRSGLGLWAASRFVADMHGTVSVLTPSGGGTIIDVRIPSSRQREFADVA